MAISDIPPKRKEPQTFWEKAGALGGAAGGAYGGKAKSRSKGRKMPKGAYIKFVKDWHARHPKYSYSDALRYISDKGIWERYKRQHGW